MNIKKTILVDATGAELRFSKNVAASDGYLQSVLKDADSIENIFIDGEPYLRTTERQGKCVVVHYDVKASKVQARCGFLF